MRSLLLLWIVFHCTFAQEVYFSEQRKNNDLFWKFEIKNLPHQSGFLYTKIVFAGGEVNSSRQRLLIRNNRTTFIYGPISKKALSGTYELQMLLAYKKIRENYRYSYSQGNPFQKKQQQLNHIDFLEKFIATIREIQDCLGKEDCDTAKCTELLQPIEKELHLLSSSVLAPYFPQSIFHAKKISQLQKQMTFEYHRNKKRGRYKAYRANIQHYLHEIDAKIVPEESFDDNSVKEDLLWCDSIMKTLQRYIDNKNHRHKQIKIMYDYFSLEIQHLQKRENQYKNSPFCQKKIYRHFKKIVLSIQKIVQLHFANLSRKYDVKIKLHNIPTQSAQNITQQYKGAVQKIQIVLEEKHKARELALNKLHARYASMFDAYKKAKVALWKNDQKLPLQKLKKQLQQLPPQLPELRRNMAQMIHFTEKVHELRTQDNAVASVYISQYKLYIQDLEKYFHQKSQ
ncbi:hypothetical protein [Candidatus Uabimicrobium amorphum]|uniref:Uncharacterized protein n=1 Tax=Uabimicrobium amorphum TaxID=2596890 RepID=A0A5S9F1Q0_UABAM|nr:hypothetical protein [Candidatus Uabimicrobium amorphum]BBM82658.1 hypothetical protein UABAM_01001 [Candidatus Uabimicrobium amorphum]